MKFPDVIDSTILVEFRACQKKASYSFLNKLSPVSKSVDLHFGGAFAKGMEVARKEHFANGRSPSEAANAGINAAWAFYRDFDTTRSEVSLAKKAKSWPTLLLALDGYFREWPLGSCGLVPHAGHKGIEFTFAIPIPGTIHPDTGSPILYGGRFDLLGEWNGLPSVCDEKTTGYFGEKWAEQWSLRNQFLGYTWASRQYGINVSQVLIRGIAIAKTQISYLQALTTFPDYMLDRWYKQLVKDLNLFAECYKKNDFSFNLGDSCNSYGGCTFMELCKSKNPEEWFSMFNTRTWNPLQQSPENKEAA